MEKYPSRKKISFAGPWITQKEVDYVTDATWNGFYENFDRYANKLEKSFCEYLGRKYAIATHCCTVALHLATSALGLNKGDEVICTDFSWIATAYAISYTGAIPVFVDIEPKTWTIDPEAIRRAITPKTKAIMLVHAFGHPANMSEIMAIAKLHNLAVIEDAAPAIGAKFKDQKVGTFGDAACFSFQGAKMTVSGEGGIFLTDNPRIYEKAKLLASMGRTDSQAVFWSDTIGYQYTIANLTAALALAQLERVDELLKRKRNIFDWYEKRLQGIPGIELVKEMPECLSNYCYPSLLLEESILANRDEVLLKLKALNIHCRPAFPRMSRFPVFAPPRFENPVAARVERRGISLASAANLNEEDIDFVVTNFLNILGIRKY